MMYTNDPHVGGVRRRIHSLDALRAFALLLGIIFHTTLSWVFPPGQWAVGASDPHKALWWFAYYAHSFRMEIFFMMAGFFACLVVQKDGVPAFLRDRGRRILLVFVVILYPMKYLLNLVWFKGGLETGWLQLSAKYSALPLWQLAYEGLLIESLADLGLTHLWFLYYLAWISALFIGMRWVLLRAAIKLPFAESGLERLFALVMSTRLAPVWMALLLTPLLTGMKRYDVEAPAQGLALQLPALAHYAFFFVVGWWTHRQLALLSIFSQRWKALLVLGLALSVVAWCGELLRVDGQVDAALTWGSRFTASLSMSLSVLGWLGLFVAVFSRPSERVHYIADSAYWLYIAHLPVVVALQVLFVQWNSTWLKFLSINLLALVALFGTYHWLVRFTWVGRWLNGPRPRVSAPLAANRA